MFNATCRETKTNSKTVKNKEIHEDTCMKMLNDDSMHIIEFFSVAFVS